MLEKFLKAVVTQLSKTFGTKDYRYYIEDTPQRFEEPCFVVSMLRPQQRSTSPVLYDRIMPVTIHFFTKPGVSNKKECYAMGERLASCIEYLNFENCLIRGDDISWDVIEENVLVMFVTYRFITERVEDKEPDSMLYLDSTVGYDNKGGLD